MLRIHDFHIDFQFQTNLVLPRDFQMALTHPWLSPDLGVSRMDPETQWTVFRDLYRYPHMYLSALLIHRHFCTFWAHPIVEAYNVVHKGSSQKISEKIVNQENDCAYNLRSKANGDLIVPTKTI